MSVRSPPQYAIVLLRNETVSWRRRGKFAVVNQSFPEQLKLPGRVGICPRMQTFGKRDYGHMDLDPWATKKRPREDNARERAIPVAKITVYALALVTVGLVAFAGFEMLVLA